MKNTLLICWYNRRGVYAGEKSYQKFDLTLLHNLLNTTSDEFVLQIRGYTTHILSLNDIIALRPYVDIEFDIAKYIYEITYIEDLDICVNGWYLLISEYDKESTKKDLWDWIKDYKLKFNDFESLRRILKPKIHNSFFYLHYLINPKVKDKMEKLLNMELDFNLYAYTIGITYINKVGN